eukprot:TRINITY_DN1779_c0_g1_i2.p3 TRINITY_DN1779_c0_g1~~TRINITY_DN1779_c0_g1_i2.p3  ORF type:complete len:117 (+),score=36.12 TRINITY_DN1779_c0_g1_i2:853-1203(+)
MNPLAAEWHYVRVNRAGDGTAAVAGSGAAKDAMEGGGSGSFYAAYAVFDVDAWADVCSLIAALWYAIGAYSCVSEDVAVCWLPQTLGAVGFLTESFMRFVLYYQEARGPYMAVMHQ